MLDGSQTPDPLSHSNLAEGLAKTFFQTGGLSFSTRMSSFNIIEFPITTLSSNIQFISYF